MSTPATWTNAILFGLFWGLCMFPVSAGNNPSVSLRRTLLSCLLAGLAVGLIDSFGWRRALHSPIAFLTIPLLVFVLYPGYHG